MEHQAPLDSEDCQETSDPQEPPDFKEPLELPVWDSKDQQAKMASLAPLVLLVKTASTEVLVKMVCLDPLVYPVPLATMDFLDPLVPSDPTAPLDLQVLKDQLDLKE